MVSFEEEGAVTAKIIDLGLAKVQDESGLRPPSQRAEPLPGHRSLRARSKLSEERWTSVRISTRWGFRSGRC